MFEIKVSIIVPIYNSEKNLDRCVNSILRQSYKNLELILINDGSTDSSLDICNNFRKLNENIIVIDQKNMGVSAARNIGLRYATGDLIQFVDSDDYIDSDMTESLVNCIRENNADLVICGYKSIFQDRVVLHKCKNNNQCEIKSLKEDFAELYLDSMINSPCNKIYKIKFIQKFFDENLSLGEDLLFNLDYLKQCRNICLIETCFYNYIREDNNSLSSIYRADMWEISKKLYNNTVQFCNDVFNENIEILTAVNTVLLRNLFGTIQLLVYNSNKKRKLKIMLIEKFITDYQVFNAYQNYQHQKLQYTLITYLIRKRMVKSIYIFFISKKKLYILINSISNKDRKGANKRRI